MGAQIARILDENDPKEYPEIIENGCTYSSDSSASSESLESVDGYDPLPNGCLSEKDFIASSNDPFRVEKRMVGGSDTWTYEIYAKDNKVNPFFSMFFAQ